MGGMGTPRTVSQAIKGRLYPSREQAATLSRMRFLLACIRERVRAESREFYEREKKGCSVGWLQKEVAQPMHRRLGWPCDALSVVNVVAMHHQALRNWWRRPDHYDAPSRRAPERCPVNPYVHNQRLETDVERGRVRLFGNKVGWMRWRSGLPRVVETWWVKSPSPKEDRGFFWRLADGRLIKINSGRVSYRGGHWYLAIQYEGPAPEYAEPKALAVGIDPGIRAMTAHDGEQSLEFARVPERSKKRRRRLDRKIARCKRGSRRHRKLVLTRSRLMEREGNMRRDRTHKATRKLIDHARIVGYEDPSAKAWQESGFFGEASREAAAGEFCRQIEYKGDWAGREVVAVPESASSTQTCYACGERTVHPLGERAYSCPHCGYRARRDENAALNVRAAAIQGARAALPEAVM